ncbi:MAG: transposase [Phycisphaerae bacterium]|nr:transposase [Phycisphaerae bacterium]
MRRGGFDPSAFPKKGTHSCGVARDWCGRLGKVENCQIGLFLADATGRGQGPLDRRLYLSQEWAADRTRRDECYVPAEVKFQERWRMALAMLDRHGASVPHGAVAADDEFGRVAAFRAGLRDRQEAYVLEVPCHTPVRDLQGRRPPRRAGQKSRRREVPFRRADAWADAYLALPHTTLATTKEFVTNAFVLYGLFKDLIREHEASAFTIRNCMSTIMPMAETTPCLTLGLLNDEGLMAFCESDFVIIPAGILLHHVSGKPVFLHNSTFPHDGVVTCAHCSSPRRLDGRRYEPAKIVTHYESEYGAAPKVEMPIGQQVTFLDPEYSTGRWLGFTGVVKSNPSYEICRSQQDVEIQSDWQKLRNEVRDSHWMMVYGDHLKELAYATRKIGVQWADLSES